MRVFAVLVTVLAVACGSDGRPPVEPGPVDVAVSAEGTSVQYTVGDKRTSDPATLRSWIAGKTKVRVHVPRSASKEVRAAVVDALEGLDVEFLGGDPEVTADLPWPDEPAGVRGER